MIFLDSIKTGFQFVLEAFIKNPKLIFVKKSVKNFQRLRHTKFMSPTSYINITTKLNI